MERLQSAEQAYDRAGDMRKRAEVWLHMGKVFEKRGDFSSARQRYEAAERQLADGVGLARARMALGFLAVWTGNHEEGLARLEQALAGFSATGDPFLIGECLVRIGSVQAEMGRHETAISYYERARILLEGAGLLRGVAGCLMGIGTERVKLREYAEGERLLGVALRLREDIGDEFGIGVCLANLGWACRLAGRIDESIEWLKAAVVHFTRLGSSAVTARAELAMSMLRSGAIDVAVSSFEQLLREPGGPSEHGMCIEGLAEAALAQHDTETARVRFHEAAARYREAGLFFLVETVQKRIEGLVRFAEGNN